MYQFNMCDSSSAKVRLASNKQVGYYQDIADLPQAVIDLRQVHRFLPVHRL